jgi:hypothetical protein
MRTEKLTRGNVAMRLRNHTPAQVAEHFFKLGYNLIAIHAMIDRCSPEKLKAPQRFNTQSLPASSVEPSASEAAG